jgi:hypothetical protein
METGMKKALVDCVTALDTLTPEERDSVTRALRALYTPHYGEMDDDGVLVAGGGPPFRGPGRRLRGLG